MIKTLYPCFQRWSEGGSVYLISDTHFADHDRKIMGYDISEEEQISILKKICHKTDTLIHLGDVGDTDYIKQLKCYKVLIMGNHDTGVSNYQKQVEMISLDDVPDEDLARALKEYDRIGYEFHKPFTRGYKDNGLFDEVYTGPLWIAEKLVLSHEPIDVRSIATGNPVAINIHGHDHSGEISADEYHYNIVQNRFGYKPLNLKKWIEEGHLNTIKSIHREIIDNATDRKKRV